VTNTAPITLEQLFRADLTEEIVIGWVKDKFGEEKVTEIETALQAQIDEKKQPSSATGLPWQN
jgi:hypothetical protein